MDIKVVNGDLLLAPVDIIVHQVNCIGVMGGGLAREIYTRYPNNKIDYLKYVNKHKNTGKPSKDLLGNVFMIDTYDNKVIANIFGQNNIRKTKQDKTVYTEEEALIEGLNKVKELALKCNYTVGIPTYLGCGMANGNWSEIKPKIEEVFKECSELVTFYNKR